jgi:hypothetical protein
LPSRTITLRVLPGRVVYHDGAAYRAGATLDLTPEQAAAYRGAIDVASIDDADVFDEASIAKRKADAAKPKRPSRPQKVKATPEDGRPAAGRSLALAPIPTPPPLRSS